MVIFGGTPEIIDFGGYPPKWSIFDTLFDQGPNPKMSLSGPKMGQKWPQKWPKKGSKTTILGVIFGPLFWPFLGVWAPTLMYDPDIRPNGSLNIWVLAGGVRTLKKGVKKGDPKWSILGGTPIRGTPKNVTFWPLFHPKNHFQLFQLFGLNPSKIAY